MFEFSEIKNKEEYNPLLISKKTPFTQAWFFGEWQEIAGRRVRRFEIKENSQTFGFFQIIKHPLIFSKSFLYIPHGPILIEKPSDEFLKVFHDKLSKIAKEENAIFVRFDIYSHNPNYGSKENVSKYFKKVPYYAYRSSYFQPKFEWSINLLKTEDELIREMHPKNRYNIRLAEKKDVKIEIIKDNFKKYFEKFFAILEETAKRDNFNLHPKIYYQNIFQTLDSDNAFLAVARYDNNFLLINLVLLYGGTAYFLFGGSSNEHKNLMFSHLGQWETIKEAKRRGFKIYNFGGVDPSTSLRVKNNNKFEGISRFKKGFGGEIFEYSDSYDIVLKPVLYYLYNLRKWLLNLR